MTRRAIMTTKAPRPVARYSQGILVNGTLYIQGVLPLDPASNLLVENSIAVQGRRVLESLKAIVEQAGLAMTDVVKVTVFLANLGDGQVFNSIYQEYFTKDPPPARTTVQAGIPLGALVEIDAVAVSAG